MADEKTHADSIRIFLTGAGAHDGAQADPNASLGNHKSSSEAQQVDFSVANPVSNLSVDYVARANGTGDGTLVATGSDTLKWTPPGGTQGEEVTIANGETKLIEAGGGEPQKYVRVTRTSASAMAGTATITIAEKANNAVGFDDVSSAEQAAGDTEYRCVCIENVSAADVQDIKLTLTKLGTKQTTDSSQLGASGAGTIGTTGTFSDWPESGFALVKESGGSVREVVYYSSRTTNQLTVPAAGRGLQGTSAAAGAASDTADAIPGISVGIEAPSSQPSGSFEDETGAGEGSAPSAVTFSSPVEDAEALDIGDLEPGQIYGIWMRRQVPAGMVAGRDFLEGWKLKFDAA